MSGENVSFNFLLNNIMRISKSATNRNDKLLKICKLLHDYVPYYDWVGIYLANLEANELVLGPFVGKPTEHTKIPFGKGICGQAAESKEIFLVQDVSSETNYLSCSAEVKSEVVVPILKQGRILGELDIDSHQISPFSKKDLEFLENISEIISQML